MNSMHTILVAVALLWMAGISGCSKKERLSVNDLTAISTDFDRWTAHPEVGEGEHSHGEEHGEHDSEHGGEHDREGKNEHN